MVKEQVIDEIDWLISEMKPGLELTPEHYDSFLIAGINCPCTILPRSASNVLITVLKNRREELL